MEIFKEIKPLRAYLKRQRVAGKSVGLVPTMGALHDGHLSLLKASQAESNVTVCSIFVNPTQFNNPSDLVNYPRTFDKDVEILKANRCDVLFCPNEAEMYGIGSIVRFDFGDLDKVLEGQFRPGHFSGVALAVSKLFNIVSPDSAYFGQKDYQQFLIVERLQQDLKFDVRLRCVPIHREKDGLAMSSRNLRLSSPQRKSANAFYQALQLAKKQLLAGIDINAVKDQLRAKFKAMEDVKLEYFELADRSNLKPLKDVTNANQSVLLIAGYVGEIRLIDNLLLSDED